MSRTSPLPEYPRPQLERSRWLSLNGVWQYEPGRFGEAPPVHRRLSERILVPFAVQSRLSGIGRSDQLGWYQRTFTIPAAWRGQRVRLNFGAVSWLARVYVNGQLAASHRGDYTAFSLDITALLHHGRNLLTVSFFDPIGAAGEPVGKQVPGPPRGFYHTACSGIWQTVWLEPVSAVHIAGVDFTPDLRHRRLVITASATGAARLVAQASEGPREVASASGSVARPLVLTLPRPRLWTPEHPFLYGLRLRLVRGGRVLDRVRSYFAMRTIGLERIGGVTRLMLNGRFVFQTGALDQGYWPDGLYTPPVDAAMRFDILAAKRLGYNLLREHVKVEPDRWYYWADRLGMLVWQDMPNLPILTRRAPSAAARAEFRRELRAIVLQLRSHPSIVVWIPFNEGWDQFDVNGITREVKRLDPSRLVDTDSGSANCCNALESPISDIRDSHLYTGPFAVAPDRRASVIGEYGGVLPYPPPGDRWPGVLTSIGSPVLAWTAEPVEGVLRQQYAELAEEMRVRGLSGAVFTELSGYEQELGILTYDRRRYTLPPELVRSLNSSLIAASQRLGREHAAAAQLPPRPSGVWNFDAGRGSAATDSSGRGQTLTLKGNAGWGRGHEGSALSLSVPGQVAVSPAPVIDTRHSFTVAAWLRVSRRGQSAAAISEPAAQGSAFSLGIYTGSQGMQSIYGEVGRRAQLSPGTASWWTFQVPAGPACVPYTCAVRANARYDDGRFPGLTSGWHLLAGAYDTSTATITLYLDGSAQDVEHADPLPPATGPLTVGAGTGDYPGSDSFQGEVDELRTYARALTPREIWQLYLSQVR